MLRVVNETNTYGAATALKKASDPSMSRDFRPAICTAVWSGACGPTLSLSAARVERVKGSRVARSWTPVVIVIDEPRVKNKETTGNGFEAQSRAMLTSCQRLEVTKAKDRHTEHTRVIDSKAIGVFGSRSREATTLYAKMADSNSDGTALKRVGRRGG